MQCALWVQLLLGRHETEITRRSCQSKTAFPTQMMNGLVAESLSHYCSCSTRHCWQRTGCTRNGNEKYICKEQKWTQSCRGCTSDRLKCISFVSLKNFVYFKMCYFLQHHCCRNHLRKFYSIDPSFWSILYMWIYSIYCGLFHYDYLWSLNTFSLTVRFALKVLSQQTAPSPAHPKKTSPAWIRGRK